MPPVFRRQLTDGRVRQGRVLLLTATVTGNPLPVVTWLHDGACVDASPDYVITYNNGECELRIEEALPQDGGVFVCKAANMLGSDQTGAAVRVERESASSLASISGDVVARNVDELGVEVVGRCKQQLMWAGMGARRVSVQDEEAEQGRTPEMDKHETEENRNPSSQAMSPLVRGRGTAHVTWTLL